MAGAGGGGAGAQTAAAGLIRDRIVGGVRSSCAQHAAWASHDLNGLLTHPIKLVPLRVPPHIF